jgi:cytochrome P450
MEDGPKYRAAYEQLAKAIPLGDVQEHVELPSAEFANKILDGMKAAGKTRFDAVEELVTAVPARLCESYFGLRIPVVPGQSDRTLFAKWTLAISSNVFGPWPDAARGKLAKAAAERFSRTIRDSIAVAKSGNGTGIVLPRLVAMQGQDPRLDDDAIHAHLFGMVMGFIPTNVLAGGNMLETLLRRPDFMSRARAAAEDDDDELLWRCLREALRFRHINPGPWRTCPNGYTFGPGGPSPYRILPESKVFALTQSAMFDPLRIDRPHVFDPYRRDEDYLVFGIGQHWCIGAYIARAQITQTLKPLLKLKRLEAVDNPRVRTRRFNDLFPLHLTVGVEFPP